LKVERQAIQKSITLCVGVSAQITCFFSQDALGIFWELQYKIVDGALSSSYSLLQPFIIVNKFEQYLNFIADKVRIVLLYLF
jgi:hypothetical protein